LDPGSTPGISTTNKYFKHHTLGGYVSIKRQTDKHGQPWDIIGKFSTFEGADTLRNGVLLTAEDTLEVKVKKRCDGFVVKSRPKELEEKEKKPRKNKKMKRKKELKNNDKSRYKNTIRMG
jgi:hypothetical protein